MCVCFFFNFLILESIYMYIYSSTYAITREDDTQIRGVSLSFCLDDMFCFEVVFQIIELPST